VESAVLQAEPPQPAVRLPGRASPGAALAQPEREAQVAAVLQTTVEPE